MVSSVLWLGWIAFIYLCYIVLVRGEVLWDRFALVILLWYRLSERGLDRVWFFRAGWIGLRGIVFASDVLYYIVLCWVGLSLTGLGYVG